MDKMAEKYGVKPKLFTKKWWEYFWDYYKYHTISVIAILFIGGISIYQAVTAPKYYFNISYSANAYLSDESEEPLRQRLSEFLTNKGTDGIGINQTAFVEGSMDSEQEYAMVTKMQLEVTDKDTIIYIFDEEKSKYFIGVSEMEGAFSPVNDWLLEEVPQDKIMSSDGVGYAVKLNESEILSECGVYSDNLYVAVRNLNGEENEKIADAKLVANAIIK